MTIYFQFSSIFKHRLTVGFLLTSIKLINLEWNLFLGTHFGKCWSLMGKADTDSGGKNLHSAKEKEALRTRESDAGRALVSSGAYCTVSVTSSWIDMRNHRFHIPTATECLWTINFPIWISLFSIVKLKFKKVIFIIFSRPN